MPKTLTEVATFDPVVTVPDGGDTRAHAAEDVELIAQVLGNRSQYLKAALDALGDAAQLGAPNNYTAVNTFGAEVVATAGTAGDDPAITVLTPPVAGDWVHAMDLRIDAGHHAHVYTSSAPDTLGALAIAYNAWWSSSANNWQKHDNAKAASALVWWFDGIRVCVVPSTLDVWTDWPLGLVYTAGIIVAGTDADRRRLTCVPLCEALLGPSGSDAPPGGLVFSNGTIWAPVANGRASLAIKIPHGANLDAIRVQHRQFPGTAHTVFTVYRLGRTGYALVGGPTGGAPTGPVTDAAEPGATTIETTIDCHAHVFDAVSQTLHLDIDITTGNLNMIYSVQLDYRVNQDSLR